MDDEYAMEPRDVIRQFDKDGWYFTDAPKRLRCGFCGTVVTPALGIRKTWAESVSEMSTPQSREIRICPDCQVATTFIDDRQFPRSKVAQPLLVQVYSRLGGSLYVLRRASARGQTRGNDEERTAGFVSLQNRNFGIRANICK